jgi:2-methylcitrate dehydratase PrpD
MTATATLVAHALSRDWAALPPDTQKAARAFLYDSICVGVAGRNAPNADRVWRLAAGWGGAGPCAVLGRGGVRGGGGAATSAPYAAFANAFQIHAQEFDCVHEAAVAHPMATVVAALLADAGRAGPVDGATFLAALVAGVDVVATLGVAVPTPLTFFRPATAGIFGSVAAIARLRRLDPGTTRDAFGHALAFAAGTMQAHLEGQPNLALQVAAAARGAAEAIDLAVAGIAAAQASIEGPFGYFALFEGGVDLGPALAALPAGRRTAEVSWKPFPTGRAAHGAIVALQAMIRDHGLTADRLDRFVYRAPPLIARLVGRRPFVGMDAPYARLCFAYLGAVTLLRGAPGLDDFTPVALADPAVHALAARLDITVDDSADPVAFVPAVATATTRDCERYEVAVTAQFGSPDWPLSRDERLAKGRRCLAFGGVADPTDTLLVVHDAFERVPDVLQALARAFG